ncbi:MAG: DUF4279 domain-containing protein [Anaerolineales bacterium]|nr:DUF4279 domain-containing protein [Anaerolineales bacterium]
MQENREFFRFTDETLQSSLIKAISDSDVVIEVLDDGTVAYPPAHSIENFIDDIVCSVFNKGWYRTEISNQKLLGRYKRLKKHNGTRVIEEIRNGKTYVVQKTYEKIYRNAGIPTHGSFILADVDLDPAQVTALLRITPTFACKKDEPFLRPYSKRRKDAPIRLSHTGWWEVCSLPHVESNDIMIHLEWLTNLLGTLTLELKQFSQNLNTDDCRVLQISIVEPSRYSGISLPSSMLTKLVNLTDRIDISFWPDDFI